MQAMDENVGGNGGGTGSLHHVSGDVPAALLRNTSGNNRRPEADDIMDSETQSQKASMAKRFLSPASSDALDPPAQRPKASTAPSSSGPPQQASVTMEGIAGLLKLQLEPVQRSIQA